MATDKKTATVQGPGLYPVAMVRTGEFPNFGYVRLEKGDSMPADAAAGEFERLDALGVFTPPAEVVVDDRSTEERAAEAPGGVIIGEGDDPRVIAPMPASGDGLEHV